MAHLVLGYPTLEKSIRTAETYIAAGVEILELQIPFSHPTADGPVITAACRLAVEQQRVTVPDCLAAIRRLRDRYPAQEIMVMSYVNRVFVYGFERFQQEMRNLGIRHLIIPDLPVDAPVPGVQEHSHEVKPLPFTGVLLPGGAVLVPVLAANVTDSRLEQLLKAGYDFFYLMSDFKITGSTFSLHPRLEQLVARIRSANPAARVGIGFGIDTPAQVKAVLALADYAIVGSALIREKEKGGLDHYLEYLKNAIRPATLAN